MAFLASERSMSLQVRRRQGFLLHFFFFFFLEWRPLVRKALENQSTNIEVQSSLGQRVYVHTLFLVPQKQHKNSCSLFVIAGRKQNGKGGCGGMKVQFNTYIQRFLTQARFPLQVISPIRSRIWKLKHRKSSFDNTTWWFQHILQHLREKKSSSLKERTHLKKEERNRRKQMPNLFLPPSSKKIFFWMLRTNYCMTIHVKKSLFFLATPAWEDNSIFHGTRDHGCLSTKGINPHADITVYPFPPHPQQCPVFSVSGGDH